MTNQSFIDISEVDFLTMLEKLPADHISPVDYCDDEMTRDDIRNVIVEKLTANN
jgi:hypothetical protein